MYSGDSDQVNNTQCCLFSSASKQTTHDNRVVQDGLIGSQMVRRSARGNALANKQSDRGINCSQQEPSYQKKKINLTKLTSRRPTISNQHHQTKQDGADLLSSYVSAPKSKISQNMSNYNNQGINFSMRQAPVEVLQSKPNSARLSYRQHHQIQQSIPLMIREVDNFKASLHRSPLVASSFAALTSSYCLPKNSNVTFQYQKPLIQQQEPLRISQAPVLTARMTNNINNPRVSRLQAPVQFPEQPQMKILLSSAHKKSQGGHDVNLMETLNLNNKNVQTLAPTLETDRIMTDSQTNNERAHRQSSQGSPMKNNSSLIFFKQDNSIAESRMTQTLMPELGRARTAASVYGGSQIGVPKKEVQESVILIDFFNPSEHLKKEIEDKIDHNNHRNFQMFNS